jgi:paraquat-inducible protein B
VSKQPNKTLIGLFVVGAVLLVIVGLLVFGSGRFFSQKQHYVMFFDESLKGLNVGAPVTFQGVKVGIVTGMKVRFRTDELSFTIPVFIEVETDTIKPYGDSRVELTPQETLAILIQRGLRARLGLQSLVTGQLQVEIDFYPDKPIKLVGYEPGFLEIPTIPTPIEALAKRLENFPIEDTLEKLANTINGLEKIATSPALHASISDLSASILDLRNMMRTLEVKAGPILAGLERTVLSTNSMIGHIDQRTAAMASGVNATLNETQTLIRNIDDAVPSMVAGVTDTTQAATVTLEQTQRSLAVLEAFFDGDTILAHNVNRTFQELAEAVRNIRILTDYLERHPEALLRGKAQPGGN